jgi:hypothetical protein
MKGGRRRWEVTAGVLEGKMRGKTREERNGILYMEGSGGALLGRRKMKESQIGKAGKLGEEGRLEGKLGRQSLKEDGKRRFERKTGKN